MSTGFAFGAKMERVIDGDTALVDPLIYPADTYLRVRFKDVFAPEVGDEGGDTATEAARAMFPQGSDLLITNDRTHWTYNRLEARVDLRRKKEPPTLREEA